MASNLAETLKTEAQRLEHKTKLEILTRLAKRESELSLAQFYNVGIKSVVPLNYCCSRESKTLCSEKTKVYNGTAKNERLFSNIKVKLRHFALILLYLQARFPHVMIFNIRIVSGFIYCTNRSQFSVIRKIAYPISERCPIPIDSDKQGSAVYAKEESL
ncbi:hypothetical protein TNCV_2687391 [Trichonephila clavipes]|nr:hypothetical protein TNCV_2687391 [Trichonephila clavipes]